MAMLDAMSTFHIPFKVAYFLHWDATGLGFVDQSLTFNSVLRFLIILFIYTVLDTTQTSHVETFFRVLTCLLD